MRRFDMCCSLALALLSASIFGIGGARADSIKDVFEKYNLLGTWAWDCSKPPHERNNWVFVNRAVDANNVQRDFMKNATERVWYAMLTQASAVGPTEVRVAGTRDGKPTESIWRVEKTRMVQWEATQDGKKIIANGRLLSSNSRDIRWLNKCDATGQQGTAPATTQIASVATQSNAPGHSVTAKSGLKTQITTHMKFDNQCKPTRVVIDVLAKPANGTVTTEPKDIVVPPETPRGGDQPNRCVGKTVRGVAVFYQSRPGFVGQDSFAYRRSTPESPNDRSTGNISYTIAVQ